MDKGAKSKDEGTRNKDEGEVKKERYIWLGEVVLTLCAYGYLVYRLVCFEGYAAWGEQLASAGIGQYVCLAVCVALFPLNIFLEACKWRYLMRKIEPMTLRGAQRQVYYGTVGAFVTPYRAGDYPARVMMMRDKSRWASAIGMALVGSVALTMVIVLAGLPAAWSIFSNGDWGEQWTVWVAISISLAIGAALPWCMQRLSKRDWKNEKIRVLADELGEMGYGAFMRTMGWSALRYVCFGVQLYLSLRFCGAELPPAEAIKAIALYYLLVTITPNIPAADLGIRSSWAVWVFGQWGVSAPACAMCAGVMWICNTVLPMIVGSLERHCVGKENI